MTQKKPLTKEEINTVGWYCKNSKELLLFLDYQGLKNTAKNSPSLEYAVGGAFYGIYGEHHVPPPKRKEVEFIHNNLYWKETEVENPDSDEPIHDSALYAEIDRTMGTLECTNLQEDVRGQFLHHLSCLLHNVRKNLNGMEEPE